MKETVIALGFFDGVHLGHAALLRRTAAEAARRGAVSALFTFDRPPKEVVTGVSCPLINSPQDRAALARERYGIQEVMIAPFNREMMTTSWQDFVTDLLAGRFHAVHLVAGHDHRFGYKNQGTPALLAELCETLGLGCDIIPKVELDGVTVSSTHIRKLLEAGEMEEANRFLGHPHILTQEVRHGHAVGRAALVPTVNLIFPPHVLSPAHGVYAAQVILPDGKRFAAVTNVGNRPTVGNGTDVTVESWLLDFDGNLYGQQIRVEFYHRIRGEIRFPTLDALREQIQSDAAAARSWFRDHPPETGQAREASGEKGEEGI